MYNPLNLTFPGESPMKKFELNIFDTDTPFTETCDQYYTEAVFANGRASVDPLLKAIHAVKDELEARVKEQEESAKAMSDWAKTPKGESKGPAPKRVYFDPRAFWKHKVWKDLEDRFCEVFGFRNAQIMPYVEKYNARDKQFETRELNAYVYQTGRFPVEALVTDKGLYDKSRSLTIDMRISLGLLRALSAEEVLAVMLHEIGHGIDPALVDIRFLETNVLSKYITDRKNCINKDEQKVVDKKNGFIVIFCIVYLALAFFPAIWEGLKRLFMGKKKYDEYQQKKLLDKIKQTMNADKRQFNRQVYSEAFADNFARMYGYGPYLMSGLQKLSADLDNTIRSRISRETRRREAITNITISMINDVHKTDMHRIRNLMREYDNDLKDPNIPDAVKKQLQEDRDELAKVLDQYFNNFDKFQNRVNKMIYEELEKLDDKVAKKEAKSKEEAVKEGFIFFDVDTADLVTESKKAYDKLMKAKESINSSERAEIKKKFGETACSFAKDKKGYYCYTHRCRSKSYETIDDIPQKDVDFVSSTS